jgi:nucleoside-diphosphate-sugar epimerase
VTPPDAAVPIVTVDLLDRATVDALVPGHDAVIHLDNLPGVRARPDTRDIYIENTIMTLNVLAAGADA